MYMIKWLSHNSVANIPIHRETMYEWPVRLLIEIRIVGREQENIRELLKEVLVNGDGEKATCTH